MKAIPYISIQEISGSINAGVKLVTATIPEKFTLFLEDGSTYEIAIFSPGVGLFTQVMQIEKQIPYKDKNAELSTKTQS